MKIQCISQKSAPPNTFLLKVKQHVVLLNCPLERLELKSTDRPQQQQQQQGHDLGSILSSFGEVGKRALDTQYSLSDNNIQHCDSHSVFRIAADLSLIDINSIDLVLIANSHLMLGLPYLTEYLGYKGRIIATEPTVEYARQLMEELVIQHGQRASTTEPSSSTHFSQLGSSSTMNAISEGWKCIYTIKDIVSCIEKIQPVRYTESQTLFSTLRLVAFSSGYSLGSANWLMETSFKKIVFLSWSSFHSDLHPSPFDAAILKNANVIIVSGLSTLTERDLFFERAKTKVLAQTARTIQSGHNVVIAACSTGIMFDLISEFTGYFKSIGMEIGHENHQTPIYVANPIAERSLKYANICGEWMTSDRQDLLYIPLSPLPHGQLMRSGALQTIHSIEASSFTHKAIREPCIVFTGDPTSASKGMLPWFIQYWGNAENACIFIDPNAPTTMQQDVSDNCKINFSRIPLDPRLKLEDITSVLYHHWNTTEHHRHLLLPDIQGVGLVKEQQNQDTHVHIYESGDVIGINLDRDWEKVSISEKLAQSIVPTNLLNKNDGTISTYAPITGLLSVYNNRFELHPITSVRDDQILTLNNEKQLWFKADFDSIVKRLESNSISVSIRQEQEAGRITIELPSDMNAKIIINSQSTIIVADDDEIRTLLRKLVVNDMQSI